MRPRDDAIPMNHIYLFPAGMECVQESQTIMNESCSVASGIRENVFYAEGLPRITVKAFYERVRRNWLQNPKEVRITEETMFSDDLGRKVMTTDMTILRDEDCDGRIDGEKIRTYSGLASHCRR